jgi:hypothetical protein
MDYRGSTLAERWAPSSLQILSMERCVWFLTFTQCLTALPDMAGRCAWTLAPLGPCCVAIIRSKSFYANISDPAWVNRT